MKFLLICCTSLTLAAAQYEYGNPFDAESHQSDYTSGYEGFEQLSAGFQQPELKGGFKPIHPPVEYDADYSSSDFGTHQQPEGLSNFGSSSFEQHQPSEFSGFGKQSAEFKGFEKQHAEFEGVEKQHAEFKGFENHHGEFGGFEKHLSEFSGFEKYAGFGEEHIHPQQLESYEGGY